LTPRPGTRGPRGRLRRGAAALALLAAGCAAPGSGHEPLLRIGFVPEAVGLEAPAAEYTAIWRADGDRIVRAMEAHTGLVFEQGPIEAIVYEGVSTSGFHDTPMRLRASYPEDTKRATLIHELGHRLLAEVVPRDFEDHPVLFLFLYDVWVELYGRPFADAQVAVESERRGIYDYEGAWRDALAMTAEERAAALRDFLHQRP
jgi:hypothetical protein